MEIDISMWGWPQWTYIVLSFIGLFIWAAMHGKPLGGTYNFMVKLLSVALNIFILTMGGFF